jgi:hypothetical protein
VVADLGLQAGVSGAQVGDEERVLVVTSRAAEVGLAEDGNTHQTVGHAKGPFRQRRAFWGQTNLESTVRSVNRVLA